MQQGKNSSIWSTAYFESAYTNKIKLVSVIHSDLSFNWKEFKIRLTEINDLISYECFFLF